MKPSSILFILFILFPITALAKPIERPKSHAGHKHFYELVIVDHALSWEDASGAASEMRHGKLKGHLATITSTEEYHWIVKHVIRPKSLTNCQFFLGGWADGFLDGLIDDAGPLGEWHWITGEEWSFAPWAPGEPTGHGRYYQEWALTYVHEWDFDPNRSGFNNLKWTMYGSSTKGFIVEYDNLPVVDNPFDKLAVSVASVSWGGIKALFR